MIHHIAVHNQTASQSIDVIIVHIFHGKIAMDQLRKSHLDTILRRGGFKDSRITDGFYLD